MTIPASLESHARASAATSVKTAPSTHPEGGEDGREAQYEQDGAEQDVTVLGVREIQGSASELGEKRGDHGQHARREERGEACEGGDEERRFGHPYAFTSVVFLRVLIGTDAPAGSLSILTRAHRDDNGPANVVRNS